MKVAGKVDLRALGGGLHGLDRTVEHAQHVDRLAVERRQAGIVLRKLECLIDQRAQPRDRFEDRVDIALRGRAKLARIAFRQHLGESADRGEWGPQFVTHIGNEGGFKLVGRFERGSTLA